jgi:hypothetical protein
VRGSTAIFFTVEECNFIEVLIWKLESAGASTDNICFGSVVEIMIRDLYDFSV